MKIKNNKNFKEKGFTIIEVMVALMILSVGLIGSLKLINYNLRNISFVGDRIFATSLAEDGMERVRNIRDTNWLAGSTWDTGIDGSINTKFIKFFCGDNSLGYLTGADEPSGATEAELLDNCVSNTTVDKNCEVFIYTNSPVRCYGDDFGSSYSGYAGVQYPNFYRLIHIDDNGDVDSDKVSVTVRWLEGSTVEHLTVTEILYNWK